MDHSRLEGAGQLERQFQREDIVFQRDRGRIALYNPVYEVLELAPEGIVIVQAASLDANLVRRLACRRDQSVGGLMNRDLGKRAVAEVQPDNFPPPAPARPGWR